MIGVVGVMEFDESLGREEGVVGFDGKDSSKFIGEVSRFWWLACSL